MSLLDSLAIITCLLAGFWIFGQFHRYHFRGLPALIATLGLLWFAASTVATLASTVGRGLIMLLGSADSPFGGLVLFGLAVAMTLGLRRWWTQRRARQLFDL